jgi:hypothetical protein
VHVERLRLIGVIRKKSIYHGTDQDNIYKHASIYGIHAFQKKKNLEYFLHKAVVADGRRSPSISGSVDLEKGDFVLEYQLYIYMDG